MSHQHELMNNIDAYKYSQLSDHSYTGLLKLLLIAVGVHTAHQRVTIRPEPIFDTKLRLTDFSAPCGLRGCKN